MKRILCFVLVILCVSCHKQGEEPVGRTLSVALYPYLQNMDEAKRIITEIWDGQNTGWTLVFDDWNCYKDSPRTDVDVFCVDCLFEQYYRNEGMISTISSTSIDDPDDFYDCFDLSGECGGIPLLLCSSEFLDRYISNGGNSLFYIPARQSATDMLENVHPVYRTLDSLASAPSAVILYGDPDFREYNNRILSAMSELLEVNSRSMISCR